VTYTMGSLFAGIGGFDLGFERAGFKTRWQVEIDPYCQKVLAKNFPEAERFGDIRECGSHNLKPVDVICGGFPCQDISYAGLGKGIDGERSGLWSEFARIIHELRPPYVLVENVAALLRRPLETQETIAMSTLETLKAARRLIEEEEHWCQKDYALDGWDVKVGPNSSNAYAFCAIGAICRATRKAPVKITTHPAYLALEEAIPRGNLLISNFNDTHTHPEVLRAFDEAIAKLEATNDTQS
jgi:hypothetical protein